MKKYILISILSIMAIFLFGCSQEKNIKVDDTKANTILLKNDGKVQAATVETFDKEYYDSKELETFVSEKISEYNKSTSADAVVLGSLKVEGGKAVLLLKYASVKDYNAFNETNAALTTVEAAKGGDITLPDVFVSASNGAYVAPEVALKQNKYKVAVIKENSELIVDGHIKYFTNGELIGKSKFQASGDEESVVIYKP